MYDLILSEVKIKPFDKSLVPDIFRDINTRNTCQKMLFEKEVKIVFQLSVLRFREIAVNGN
jgi:hypothetical protein